MKKTILFCTTLMLVLSASAEQDARSAQRRNTLKKMTDMTLQKRSSQLPPTKATAARVVPRDVVIVQPPSST